MTTATHRFIDDVSTPPSAWHHAPVLAAAPVADRYHHLRLRAPDIARGARPGQFALLGTARSARAHVVRPRPMAIVRSDPAGGTIDVVFRVSGRGTRALATCRPGDELSVLGPLGQGFRFPQDTTSVLLVGRGTGTCALVGVAELARARGAEVCVLTSARHDGAVLGSVEYRSVGVSRLIVVTDAARTSDVDAVRRRLLTALDDRPPQQIFTCGSDRIVRLCIDLARRWGSEVQASQDGRVLRVTPQPTAPRPVGSLPPLPVRIEDVPGIRSRSLHRRHDVDTAATVGSHVRAIAHVDPARPAIESADARVTYGELANLTAAVQARLLTAGCGPGEVVAVTGRRCAATVAAFLALESVGAVYVPVDPTWPSERLETVLRRSRATMLVVAGAPDPGPAVRSATAAAGCPMLTLDGTGSAAQWPDTARDRADDRRADEVRYLIYTSGTTGVPKGVAVEHRGMMNHLWAKVLDLDLSAGDTVAFTAPLTFDISIWQMLAPLLVGARVAVFSDGELAFPGRLSGALRRRAVTVAEFVPTVVGWLLDRIGRGEGLPALRWLISTGEELPPALATRALDALPAVRLLNAYGPTECSDDVTHHEVRREDLALSRIPVGVPIINATLYVLVREVTTWRSADEGEAGELFVGGIPVGAGYPDDAAAAEGTFFRDVLDPTSPTGRLYRTGDAALVRDGRVHCLGRVDRQVKVAGVRMELGEIEATVGRHPGVGSCAVVVDPQGDVPELVAYVVPAADAVPVGELRAFAGATLPVAMVPHRWHVLDALPLTSNGKVDHTVLEAAAKTTGGAGGRPVTDMEGT